jgi:hypothetical protein
VLRWATGATAVSAVPSALGSAPSAAVLVAAGALLLAAMIQSALLPFHAWLLSSMTAPTPASALMHAGFVNAGGILLVRFAPVVSVDASVLLAIVPVGATSAILGKLLKTVRTDTKGKLGCSTVGQMGFMIMQAGLGFFGAAVTHLILHGFYRGNGGDLLTGLPLQSVASTDAVPYHQPLRLSTVVHAPTDRVTAVLADHDDLATLLDNGWLSLTVVDPERDHRAFHYAGDLEWTSMSHTVEPEREPTPISTDD